MSLHLALQLSPRYRLQLDLQLSNDKLHLLMLNLLLWDCGLLWQRWWSRYNNPELIWLISLLQLRWNLPIMVHWSLILLLDLVPHDLLSSLVPGWDTSFLGNLHFLWHLPQATRIRSAAQICILANSHGLLWQFHMTIPAEIQNLETQNWRLDLEISLFLCLAAESSTRTSFWSEKINSQLLPICNWENQTFETRSSPREIFPLLCVLFSSTCWFVVASDVF